MKRLSAHLLNSAAHYRAAVLIGLAWSVVIGTLAWSALSLVLPVVARAAETQPERVRIIPDQAAGTVTITIDGVPTLRVSKTGLEVSGSLFYSGGLKDTGSGMGQSHAR